ncbi:MAG: VCBS repeat-containing protein [Myxococcota bacterium]
MLHRLAVFALVTWLLPAAAAAQPTALPFPPSPPGHAARLSRDIIVGLEQGLARVPESARVAIVVRALPAAPASGRAESWLADTLEASWRATPRPLVRVGPASPEITHRLDVAVHVDAPARVDVEARLVALPATFWERLRAPDGEVLATALAEAPLDLEMRTLFGLGRRAVRFDRLRLVALRDLPPSLARAPLLDLALIAPDGRDDERVLALQPDRLFLLRWAKRGLVIEAEVPLTAPPASVTRVRQAMGRVVVSTRADGTQAAFVASSDRAHPEVFAVGTGLVPIPTQGMPAAWPLYATGVDRWLTAPWPSGTDVLEGGLGELAWISGAVSTRDLGVLEASYDLRAHPFYAAASPAWTPYVAAAHPEGDLAVWSIASPDERFTLDGVGTVSALSDLDLDGRPELLATSNALGGPDHLSLYELSDAGDGAHLRWSRAVPDPVSAAVAGDLDGDGYAELLVATWSSERAGVLVLAPTER